MCEYARQNWIIWLQAWRVKYNDRSYNSPDGNPYSADYPHYRSAEFGTSIFLH